MSHLFSGYIVSPHPTLHMKVSSTTTNSPKHILHFIFSNFKHSEKIRYYSISFQNDLAQVTTYKYSKGLFLWEDYEKTRNR